MLACWRVWRVGVFGVSACRRWQSVIADPADSADSADSADPADPADLPVIVAVSKSSLPRRRYVNTPIRRPADTLPQPR